MLVDFLWRVLRRGIFSKDDGIGFLWIEIPIFNEECRDM